LRLDGRAPIAHGVLIIVARHGTDYAVQVDAAQAVAVGEEQVALEVGCQVENAGELGRFGGAAIARKARSGDSGGGDPVLGAGVLVDLRDGVGHKDVARQIERRRHSLQCAIVCA